MADLKLRANRCHRFEPQQRLETKLVGQKGFNPLCQCVYIYVCIVKPVIKKQYIDVVMHQYIHTHLNTYVHTYTHTYMLTHFLTFLLTYFTNIPSINAFSQVIDRPFQISIMASSVLQTSLKIVSLRLKYDKMHRNAS